MARQYVLATLTITCLYPSHDTGSIGYKYVFLVLCLIPAFTPVFYQRTVISPRFRGNKFQSLKQFHSFAVGCSQRTHN